jgi:hypothetical protein
MNKAKQSVLHMSAIDGEYQHDATIMRGAPDDMLALLCTALHMYIATSDTSWKRTAKKLITDLLRDEVPDGRNPRDDRILGALLFVAGIFSLFGVICFVSMVMAKLTGRA